MELALQSLTISDFLLAL